MHHTTQYSYVYGRFGCEILSVEGGGEERRGGVALTEPHTHSRICRHSLHYLVLGAALAHNIPRLAHNIFTPKKCHLEAETEVKKSLHNLFVSAELIHCCHYIVTLTCVYSIVAKFHLHI